MLNKKTLLTANNLNNAYLSLNGTTTQAIASNFTINGGELKLINSIFSDSASAGYLRIDAQGNKIILYDGVNNQEFHVYSSSGNEALYLQGINGTTSYGNLDVTASMNHLKIMGNSGKRVDFGGDIDASGISSRTGLIASQNPANTSATISLSWVNNDPRLRIGGSGTGASGVFRIQGTSDIDRMTVDASGNIVSPGSLTIGSGTVSQLINQADGSIRHQNTEGYIEFGPKDTTNAHIYTDRTAFYMNKDILINGNKVWHIGNDGSGSGLDADTLDGKQATDLLNITVSGTLDVDTLTGTNIYTGSSSGWTNKGPSGHNGSGLLSLNTHAGSYYSQLWFDTNGDNFYHRSIDGGVKRAWAKVWTNSNDGSGSGLDADLLDGQQLSDLDSRYVNTVGDTMTGDLTILKNNPWITLDSSSSGGNGVEQGAGISIGESGYKGEASIHITYTGDGKGHIGMGAVDVTTGLPLYEAMELFYTNNTVKFFSTPNVAGNPIWHTGNDGAGSGLDADLLDGLNSSSYMRTDANTSTTGTITIGTGTTTTLTNSADGSLTISSANGNIEIGPKNTSYSHIYTDRPYFYFNKQLLVLGSTVWNSGNDGSGSGLDADTVDGIQLSGLVQTSRTISTGTGLNGGGALSANLSLSLDTTYTDGRYVNKTGDTLTGTYVMNETLLSWARDSDRAYIRFVDYGADSDFLTFDFGDASTDLIRFRNDRAGVFTTIFDVAGTKLDSYVPLHMGNNSINEVSYLHGQYGNIARSTDEYLRLNDTGSHTSGVYSTGNFQATGTIYELGSALSARYLGISAKAYDSDRFDGLDSTSFVRKDIGGNNEFYSTDIANSYSNAGIEMREVNLVGATQSSDAYAPALAFHWGGRVQSRILLSSDGDLKISKGSGTPGLIYNSGNFDPNSKANLSGATFTGPVVASTVSATSGDTTLVKYSFWSGSESYGMGMASAFTYGYLNDYATFFNMNNAANRGWIWRYDGQAKSDGAMSLTTDGRLYVKDVVDAKNLYARGNVETLNGTYSLLIGKTPYYNGSLSGGDSIYSNNSLQIGASSAINLWAETNGVYLRYGAVGSSKVGLGLAPSGRLYAYNNVHLGAEEVATFYDSTNNGEQTYRAISTSGWYTIAYNGNTATPGENNGGDRAYAKFTVQDATSGRHELIQFTAGTAFNASAGVNLKVLGFVRYTSTGQSIGAVRVLTAGTYATQFVQVYFYSGATIKFIMEDNHWQSGWKPADFILMSSIPSGYVDNKLELDPGYQNVPRNIYSGPGAPPSSGSFKGDIYVEY